MLGLARGEAVTGAAVGSRERLIEEPHELVNDLGMTSGQRRQQDRVAPLRCHLAQRPRRRAPRDHRQLTQTLRRDRGEVQALGAEVSQVGELHELGLDGLRGRARRAIAEPHQRRDIKLRVGDHEGVQTSAQIGDEDWLQPLVDLPCGCGSRAGDGPHQAVGAGANDLLGLQMIEGLPEQNGLRVVLERSRDEPVAERAPLAGPARVPSRPSNHRLSVLATRPVALTHCT